MLGSKSEAEFSASSSALSLVFPLGGRGESWGEGIASDRKTCLAAQLCLLPNTCVSQPLQEIVHLINLKTNSDQLHSGDRRIHSYNDSNRFTLLTDVAASNQFENGFSHRNFQALSPNILHAGNGHRTV